MIAVAERDRRVPRALWGLLAAALLARLLLIAVDSSLGILVKPDIMSTHHQNVAALVGAWFDGQPVVSVAEIAPPRHSSLRHILVGYLLAPFYVFLAPVTGLSPVPGQIGIAVYSLGLGALAYALARECRLPTRPALTVAGLAVFWPGVIYRSIVIQREIFVALATLAVVWVGVRWARQTTDAAELAATAAVATVASVALFVIRPENLLVVGTVLVAGVVVRYRDQTAGLVATGVLTFAAVGYVATLDLGTFIGGKVGLTPATLDDYAHARAHGDTAYLTWLHYESWLDIALFAPLKVVYYLASPMVWTASGVPGLLAGTSGLALLGASALAVYGVVVVARRQSIADPRAVAVLVTFLVVGIGAYAVIEMNGGAAFRRRITFVPAILTLAMIGVLRAAGRGNSPTISPSPLTQ